MVFPRRCGATSAGPGCEPDPVPTTSWLRKAHDQLPARRGFRDPETAKMAMGCHGFFARSPSASPSTSRILRCLSGANPTRCFGLLQKSGDVVDVNNVGLQMSNVLYFLMSLKWMNRARQALRAQSAWSGEYARLCNIVCIIQMISLKIWYR